MSRKRIVRRTLEKVYMGIKNRMKKSPDSVNDPKQIAKMLESTDSKERIAALEKLEGNVGDLKDVARYSEYEDTRMAAVERLEGESKFVK